MDQHYDLVMRARAAAAGAAPRSYFAYSTVLDRAAFLDWRAQHNYGFFDLPEGRVAEAVDTALTFDFPSRWWGGRVAGLVDQKGSSVWGVVFSIAGGDWPIVQHKEGGITGMSVEREVVVRIGGASEKAIAFTTAPSRASMAGPVSAAFVEALARGARGAGLPEAWTAALPSLAR